MTRPTRTISTLAGTRGRTAAVAVALIALALSGVVAAGAATAQTGEPTVAVSDGTTAPDGTTTVAVVLTNVPDGLSGYYLELTAENPDLARIESASYPDRFGLTSEPVVGSDGATVALEAADIESAIEPGATDVTLATVTVAGAAPGDVELTVEPRQFDDDTGSAFTPATQSGTVTVTGGDAEPTLTDRTTDSGNEAESTPTDRATDGQSEREAGSTSTSLPLSPVYALIAIGLVAATEVRRRR